jgi:TM2 domain-containing membrane protein YozV
MSLSPRNATLLSLVLPGSAQFALGKPARGALALVSTMALFFLGWAVLRDRLWFFQFVTPPNWLKPLFAVLPLQIMPEGMNVAAAAIAGFLRTPESFAAERLTRMPVPGEHWAMMLTGASGIVSVLWAADAHWLARGGPRAPVAPAFAAFVSWLVPGLGHAMAGQKSKGWLMGAAVAIVFALGMLIAQGHGVDRQFFGLWWSGAALFAPGLLVVSFVTGPMQLAGEIPPLLDYGVALCTCAGLMNAMVISDAYTVAERGAREVNAMPAEAAA